MRKHWVCFPSSPPAFHALSLSLLPTPLSRQLLIGASTEGQACHLFVYFFYLGWINLCRDVKKHKLFWLNAVAVSTMWKWSEWNAFCRNWNLISGWLATSTPILCNICSARVSSTQCDSSLSMNLQSSSFCFCGFVNVRFANTCIYANERACVTTQRADIYPSAGFNTPNKWKCTGMFKLLFFSRMTFWGQQPFWLMGRNDRGASTGADGWMFGDPRRRRIKYVMGDVENAL